MRTPSKEELDNYIFSHGFDAAIRLFNITEKKAENILFAKPNKVKTDNEEDYFITIIPELDPIKLKPLFSIIKRNYTELRKSFIGKQDTQEINKHSNSIEDTFHDSLMHIFENCDIIIFDDEEQTLKQIRYQLFNRKRVQHIKVRRDKAEFTELKETFLTYIQEEESAPNSILSNARIIIEHALYQPA